MNFKNPYNKTVKIRHDPLTRHEFYGFELLLNESDRKWAGSAIDPYKNDGLHINSFNPNSAHTTYKINI